MEEPDSVEDYYIMEETIEVDGKRGKGKIKKWFDNKTNTWKQRVLKFEGYDIGEE